MVCSFVLKRLKRLEILFFFYEEKKYIKTKLLAVISIKNRPQKPNKAKLNGTLKTNTQTYPRELTIYLSLIHGLFFFFLKTTHVYVLSNPLYKFTTSC